ncbi:hypothetical protein [Nonomuraea basaltis]|uniref:hypothetical protein n=1 Tax=Nonomuraea basaltis TaxID=2495887 RepID=UPI00110C4294|nr:hypothetical protein [Nonomuraea basaltis]TMR97566.1 hypothetical protein EJK15_17770 [Nonomuraea basaltis]
MELQPYETTFTVALPDREGCWDAVHHVRHALLDWSGFDLTKILTLVDTRLGIFEELEWIKVQRKIGKKTGSHLPPHRVTVTGSNSKLVKLEKSLDFATATVTFVITGFKPPTAPAISFHLRIRTDDANEPGKVQDIFRQSVDTFVAMRTAHQSIVFQEPSVSEGADMADSSRELEELIDSGAYDIIFNPWWRRLWRLISTQPLMVQIVGGTVATVVGAGLIALVAKLL